MSEVLETTIATTQSKGMITNHNIGELHSIQAAYKLNEKNYLKWSQLISTFLKGKGKIKSSLGNWTKESKPLV